MRTPMIARTTLGLGAILGAALSVPMIAPATVAGASSTLSVPCSGSGGGAAGLIAAINTLNKGGGGTVNLAGGCTYALTSPDNANPKTGANGLPVVTTTITVNGADGTTIAGNNSNFRIFEVDAPGNLTLQDLTVTGGSGTFGGGILNAEGTVTLNFTTVTGNTASMGGGGIASGVVNPNDLGPSGTLTLNFSLVTSNTALSSGGGGILNHAGTLNASFSQVTDNTSDGGGGGIASGPGNGTGAGGSNLNLYVTVVNWNASYGGPMDGAGGIANGGAATILTSQVEFNSAPGAPGGGILNHGTMIVGFSNVTFNSAPTDDMGNPGLGGGIANISGALEMDWSNVNRNSASGLGGGIFEAGFNESDGSFSAPGNPLVLNATFVEDNTSANGGGIYTTVGSPVALNPSWVLMNFTNNCFPVGTVAGCSG